jgi:uncharacterized protein with NAD-binding domain and iron-sulfur cluster
MTRTKVAVLGGGMAALTTALELTATPELRDRYEVTVHQLGWRLGGKCATGRNQAIGDRIEEHGLHLWYGGYDNAFAMLKQCYDELDRPHGSAVRSLEDAFEPVSYGVLYDYYDGSWSHSVAALPTNSERPGDPVPPPAIFDLIETGIDAVILAIESARGDGPPAEPVWRHGQSLPSWARHVLADVEEGLAWLGDEAESGLLHAAKLLCGHRRPSDHEILCRMLDEFRDWFWEHRAVDHLDDTTTRHLFCQLDFFTSVLVGLLRERLITTGFDSINDLDLRDWLTRHGLRPVSLTGPAVRSLYDEAFTPNLGPTVLDLDAGVPLDTAKQPGELAAGAMVLVIIREFFCYRGSILWKPTSGYADVVVTPMYEVLRDRGVQFEFFHRVDALHLSPDRKHVDGIDVTVQAQTIDDRPYDPVIPVKGLDCWPSAPRWEQLEGGAQLAADRVDFEVGAVDEARHETLPLRRGEHFDLVVLGVSAAALPPMCRELLADEGNPRFTEMLAHTHTVMTQAFQAWSTRTLHELGWPYDEVVSSCFIEPLDTYCDMTELLPRESWVDEDGIKSVGYFCGMLEDTDDDSPDAAGRRARDGALDYLGRHMRDQWSAAVDPATGEFDWTVLHDREGRQGPDRLDAQFIRANYERTERYVQTPPGTVKYRLAPDESGYDNLFLTGDWIRTGLNVGCVESAVMGGMFASRAISGSPEHMAREDHLWTE